MSTELYKVPRYSRVKVDNTDLEVEFDHVDGMYSYCTDADGHIIHLAAWTPVEIIREGPADGT